MTRRAAAITILFLACGLTLLGSADAQRGATGDWMTVNGDAQRSSWVRSDPKISRESMQKPGFTFLWKLKLNNKPKQLNSLTPPATLERLIGYRGFRMLGFVGGSSDKVFTIDTDLGRLEWEKQLSSSASPQGGDPGCPGGMTTSVVRPTTAFIPSLDQGGRGGSGRSSFARSAVGNPGEGAVTLAQVRPSPPQPAPPPRGAASEAPRPSRTNPPGGQFGAGPFLVFALSSDGMLHLMHLSNGADYEHPIRFLPPNANANGLIVVDNIAYAATEGSCGGAPNGLWALDLDSKQVATWKGHVSGSAGPAFGPDGTIYVTTKSGAESADSRSNSIVALDPKSLSVKGWYVSGSPFSSSPVVLEHKGRALIAAATLDGRIHLLDAASPGANDHKTALFITRGSSRGSDPVTGSLAASLSTWRDPDGTIWILAPTAGKLASEVGFTSANGVVTNGAVVAWRVVDQNGVPALQPGWASRDLTSPLTPTIINGVVFVTSSGEFRTDNKNITAQARAQRSGRAVIYALDGLTGKELWSSGTRITSFARGGALSGGMGQVYLTTYDSTIYAFGFPMEH